MIKQDVDLVVPSGVAGVVEAPHAPEEVLQLLEVVEHPDPLLEVDRAVDQLPLEPLEVLGLLDAEDKDLMESYIWRVMERFI